jgi:hypothetical protein
MDKQEQSRQEWEKEIREVQGNITPDGEFRAAHYIAKKSSSGPIPDVAHLVRLVLGCTLVALGIRAFSSEIPHSAAIGVAVLAAGVCLGFTGFRWTRKSG